MAEPAVQRDYYEVLGVPPDADQKSIEEAFHELALRYHPDHSKDPDAIEKFKDVSRAYAVLSDRDKRRQYDAQGFAGVSGYSDKDLFGGLDLGNIFGNVGGLGFGSSIFDRAFGHRPRTGPRKGGNVEVGLEVPLRHILTGGKELVRVKRLQKCSECGGVGAKPGTQPRKCDACVGTGQHIDSSRREGVSFQQITTCPVCHGRGQIIDTPCPDCDGRGEVEHKETIEVNIPIGIGEGRALRITGRGQPSSDSDGTPGDLYVFVTTAPDLRFERRGPNLWHVETVEIHDAVLGTKLQVPTLDGEAIVTIPPGTQSGTVFRLHDQGLPILGGGERGDIYVEVRLHVQEHLNSKERTLYERIRTLSRKTK